MIKSFVYELQFPIKVASEGKEKEGVVVEIKAPRPKDSVNCMVMESKFTQCIGKGLSVFKDLKQEEASQLESDTSDKQDEAIMSLIMMGAETNDIQCLDNILRDLVCEGNTENPQATVEDVKFTKPMYDELHYKDRKVLLGKYISSFLSSTLT